MSDLYLNMCKPIQFYGGPPLLVPTHSHFDRDGVIRTYLGHECKSAERARPMEITLEGLHV